jgi:hypothetical protein
MTNWEEQFDEEFVMVGGCGECATTEEDACVHNSPSLLKSFIRKAIQEAEKKAKLEMIEEVGKIKKQIGYNIMASNISEQNAVGYSLAIDDVLAHLKAKGENV